MTEQRNRMPKPEIQYEMQLLPYVPGTYETGKEWEKAFAQMCKERGFAVTLSSPTCEYDMVVSGFRVQCKKTDFVDKCGGNGRIRISRGSGCSAANNYAADAFDLFAVAFERDCFIVPVEFVGIVNGKIKRRVSINRLMQFKDNWGVFNGYGITPQQMELF